MRPPRRALRSLAGATLLLAAALAAGPGGAEGPGRVHASADAVQPLPPGAQVPSVRVQAADGGAVDLAERVRERGALLVFYRGGW